MKNNNNKKYQKIRNLSVSPIYLFKDVLSKPAEFHQSLGKTSLGVLILEVTVTSHDSFAKTL